MHNIRTKRKALITSKIIKIVCYASYMPLKKLPVRRVSIANSKMNVPTLAVHVTVVSPSGTPCIRLTVPYGIEVVVLKATKIM